MGEQCGRGSSFGEVKGKMRVASQRGNEGGTLWPRCPPTVASSPPPSSKPDQFPTGSTKWREKRGEERKEASLPLPSLTPGKPLQQSPTLLYHSPDA